MEVRIGKRGIEKVLPEIKRQLKRFKKLKIRVNTKLTGKERKNFLKSLAVILSKKLGVKASKFVGKTFMIRKEGGE